MKRIYCMYSHYSKSLSLLLVLLLLFTPSSAMLEKIDSQPRFTEELWESIDPVYQSILEHPFVNGLADGSLPEESFRFYIIQDALYLRKFAHVLSILSTKSPKNEWAILFAQHAKAVLEEEKAMHEGFFSEWGLTEKKVYSTAESPTNLSYTSYLLMLAQSASFEEILSAVLPCYWIYWEVGKELYEKKSPHTPYEQWIDTYAAEDCGVQASRVRAILEEAVAGLPEDCKARIRNCFYTASCYEWMFWNAAWHLESWPLAKLIDENMSSIGDEETSEAKD